LFYFDGESETALGSCVLRVTSKKRSPTFFRKKVHRGDLAGGFSDLEMTWLLYCAGAATANMSTTLFLPRPQMDVLKARNPTSYRDKTRRTLKRNQKMDTANLRWLKHITSIIRTF